MNTENPEPSFLARGYYGSVYRGYFGPITEPVPFTGPYVCKLLTESGVDMELEGAHRIRQVDPRGLFTVLGPHVCKLPLNKKKKRQLANQHWDRFVVKARRQLIYQDGGSSLQSLCDRDLDFKRLIRADPTYLCRQLSPIYRGLLIMQKHQIIHGDIKADNIVVGPYHSNYRLIDYGFVQTYHQYQTECLVNYTTYSDVLDTIQIPMWAVIGMIRPLKGRKKTPSLTKDLTWMGFTFQVYFGDLYHIATLSDQDDPAPGKQVVKQLIPYVDFYLLGQMMASIYRQCGLKIYHLSDQLQDFLRASVLPINIESDSYHMLDMSAFSDLFKN